MSPSTPIAVPHAAEQGESLFTNLVGQHVHFTGIGGCGMSGLARLVRQAGAVCTGSDPSSSPVVDALRREGFQVAHEQSASSVPRQCDWVVISAAIGHDHPEVTEAARRGIGVIKYATMLGQLMLGRTGVAIAGTHGKSTTTSMLCHILVRGGLDPSFIIGASCPQIGGGARCGRSDLLVAEACEFDRSFHHLHPRHAVILNIEEDHLDVYGSIDAIVEAFAAFAQRLPEHGSLLIHDRSPHRSAVTLDLRCPTQAVGFSPQADWRVQVIQSPPTPSRSATHAIPWVYLYHDGRWVTRWQPRMPGEHMAYNAAAAAVTAHRLGVSWPEIGRSLSTFAGLDRRMQHLGLRPTPWAGTTPLSSTHVKTPTATNQVTPGTPAMTLPGGG